VILPRLEKSCRDGLEEAGYFLDGSGSGGSKMGAYERSRRRDKVDTHLHTNRRDFLQAFKNISTLFPLQLSGF